MQFDWKFPDGALPALPRHGFGLPYRADVSIRITGTGERPDGIDDPAAREFVAQQLLDKISVRMRGVLPDARSYEELALAAAEGAAQASALHEQMLRATLDAPVSAATRVILCAPWIGDGRYRGSFTNAEHNPGRFAVISLPGGVVTMHRPARPFEKLRRRVGF